jgi:hypothetical protein
MCIEKMSVKLACENTIILGRLELYEESPDDEEQVLIRIYFSGQKISKMGRNFFEALQNLREELENKNIQIICNGAAKNVYPSPMQMSMGDGRTAYLLKLGQQARSADIVGIFDCIDTLTFVGTKEQKAFYSDWLKSVL